MAWTVVLIVSRDGDLIRRCWRQTCREPSRRWVVAIPSRLGELKELSKHLRYVQLEPGGLVMR